MRRRPIALCVAAALGSTALVGGPSPARADDIDYLGGKVVEITARVDELGRTFLASAKADTDLADRRLIDAQVLYELRNYEAASLILLDIVEKYPNHQVYPEALFFLGDSLFLKRDFLSSRRYFEKLASLGPSNKRYQEALQRLIELSLYTGDYNPVDGYLAALEGLPPGAQRASVPYVKGKYYYFRQKYDQADLAFKEIGTDHVYWFHSQYFVGSSLVARGKLADAINVFSTIVRTEAKTDAQKRITELAHLALGRIFYDRGQLTNAAAEYGKIGLRSDLQADALYEQAWVNIKSKEYKKAYRALDTLLTLKPDDPLVPEVKLLIGNLRIRQGEYAEATEAFTKTRDEFEPIRKQLESARTQETESYFRELIGKNLGKFDTATFLPPLAVKWVRAEPDMERVINLVTDVGDIKKSLEESAEIVKRLERALSGPQRINVFPDLVQKRAGYLAIDAELTEVKKRLVTAERELVMEQATPEERQRLDEIAAERRKLEVGLGNAPSDASSLEERQKMIRGQFDELDKKATILNALIASYAAERVAIEIYYRDTKKEQKGDPGQAQREFDEARAIEEDLRRQYESLRHEISDAAQSAGIDDREVIEAQRTRRGLAEVFVREHDAVSEVRPRLGEPARSKANQIASILDRAFAADRSLNGFDDRINAAVEARLKDIRIELAEESAHVAEYQKLLGGYETETVDVGGGITAENFRMVADRFYQIVVRADVGIIDVAWALKQTRTDDNNRLAREQKRELKALDDEYKEALKE